MQLEHQFFFETHMSPAIVHQGPLKPTTLDKKPQNSYGFTNFEVNSPHLSYTFLFSATLNEFFLYLLNVFSAVI